MCLLLTINFYLYILLAHVKKLPTFRWFRLKKQNKNMISKQLHVNSKSRMITIIEISKKTMLVSCSYVPILLSIVLSCICQLFVLNEYDDDDDAPL